MPAEEVRRLKAHGQGHGCPIERMRSQCLQPAAPKVVITGLDPVIHAVIGMASDTGRRVDDRIKSGHDDLWEHG